MNEVAGAIKELSGLVKLWIKTSPTRRMKSAIRNADKYINANELKDKETRRKLLARYKHRFNKYKIG